MNYEDDPDATGLRIIIVPANHFLPAEGLPNVPVVPRTAPVIAGGDIQIAADDVLHVPAFYGLDEFPEPEVVEVEAPDDDTVAPVIHGLTG